MAGRKLSEPWKCPDCGKVTRFAFRLDDSEVQHRQCQGWKNFQDRIPCMHDVELALDNDGNVRVLLSGGTIVK